METVENQPHLTATVYRELSDLAQIKGPWRDLHSDSKNPFTDPAWVENWWNIFGQERGIFQKKPQLIVLRDVTEQLRAVFPMAETSIGIYTRLNAAGAIPKSKLVELTPFLIAQGFEEAAARSLVKYFGTLRDYYHGIDLGGIPRLHPFGIALAKYIPRAPIPEDPYFIVHLPQDVHLSQDEKFDKLRPAGRDNSNKRRQIRQAETAVEEGVKKGLFGKPQSEIVTDPTPTEILISMGQFFKLHRARAQMKNVKHHDDNYSDSKKRKFILNVATELAAGGNFFLANLIIDGQVVAAELLLPAGNELFLYSTAFDPKKAKDNVMARLVTEIMKWAIDNNFSTVNLSPGRAQNKAMWDPEEVPVVSFRISPTSLSHRIGEKVYDEIVGLRRNLRVQLNSIRKARFHSS